MNLWKCKEQDLLCINEIMLNFVNTQQYMIDLFFIKQ